MSTPKDMILSRPVKWRGKMLKKGTKVSASFNERARLLRLGWASDYYAPHVAEEAPVAKPKRTYKRKDVAEAPEKAVIVPEPPHVLPPESDDAEPAKDESGYRFHWPKPKSISKRIDPDDGKE